MTAQVSSQLNIILDLKLILQTCSARPISNKKNKAKYFNGQIQM